MRISNLVVMSLLISSLALADGTMSPDQGSSGASVQAPQAKKGIVIKKKVKKHRHKKAQAKMNSQPAPVASPSVK